MPFNTLSNTFRVLDVQHANRICSAKSSPSRWSVTPRLAYWRQLTAGAGGPPAYGPSAQRPGCSARAAGCTSRCAHSLWQSGSHRTRAPRAAESLHHGKHQRQTPRKRVCYLSSSPSRQQQSKRTFCEAEHGLYSSQGEQRRAVTRHEAHSQVLHHDAIRCRKKRKNVRDEMPLIICTQLNIASLCVPQLPFCGKELHHANQQTLQDSYDMAPDRLSQSRMSCERSTSSTVQKLATAFLYMSKTSRYLQHRSIKKTEHQYWHLLLIFAEVTIFQRGACRCVCETLTPVRRWAIVHLYRAQDEH